MTFGLVSSSILKENVYGYVQYLVWRSDSYIEVIKVDIPMRDTTYISRRCVWVRNTAFFVYKYVKAVVRIEALYDLEAFTLVEEGAVTR